MSSSYRLLAVASLLSLLHAAYSAAQHRLYLRLTEQPFSSLPADIVAQTLVSLVLLILACSFVAGSFQLIRADIQNQKRKWEDVAACPSFITFDHRAKALSPAFALLSNPFPVFSLRIGRCSLRNSSSSVSSAPSSSNPSSPDFSRLPGARFPSSSPSPSVRRPPTRQQAQQALSHCVSLLRKHDTANYLAALLMPRQAQHCIFAILAVNAEIALTRDKVSQLSSSPMYRLQFWRDTFSAIYEGKGLIPQLDLWTKLIKLIKQPSATALQVFAPSASFSLLDSLALSRQRTIGDRPFPSLQHVCDYGRQSTGSLIRLQMNALCKLKEGEEKVEEAINSLSESFALLNLVRCAGPFTLRSIVVLPADILSLYGVTPDNVVSGKNPDDLCKVIKHLVEEGETRLKRSRSLRDWVRREHRPAFLAVAAQCEYIVKQSRAAHFDIRSPLLQRPRPFLPWRLAARRIASTF